jgi:hypothetical protein
MSDSLPKVTPEQRRDASITLAETALRLNDPCGLRNVLEALSLKEVAEEPNDG